VVSEVLLELAPASEEPELDALTEQVRSALDPATAATVRRISVVKAADVPTGATGKVRKAVLREQGLG
jgi:hypothetical protein